MPKTMIRVTAIAIAGRDPEVRTSQTGNKFATLSIATHESFKQSDGNWKEITEWHNVVTFGKTAEYIEKYLKKGMTIYVEGRLKTRKYTDKNGIEKYSTEIIGDKFIIMDKLQATEQPQTEYQSPTQPEITTDFDDDIPF